ncbi:unnamed protein product (macronuclear) [Paramecium tetraurelia]|uniref:Uncharacterized protein n=1 Tax=Paramecium tetraurelia TaxID=5888 RepID=A0DTK2_PARTE|nr:uncharacterized protein GSPATT00020050001 [Paramecium tetraurelia]CAK86369.1 unnamed protein product [Paramecium tetraurelia]|eukprot:XP_001453766.1 hypothetical protein (macronuclear) [Paramecium tetraurelia strain d4-2]
MELQNDDFLNKILEQSLQEFNELQKKLEIVQKRESELKSQPQYKQSEIFKSIKNVKYPSFTSYTQRQEEKFNQNQNHFNQEPQSSHIVHQQDFQNDFHQIQQAKDFSYNPPVIERVSSELIEESAIIPNEAMHDQKQKMEHQKNILIRKKNEIIKSELLKFEQDKKPQTINQTQYIKK